MSGNTQRVVITTDSLTEPAPLKQAATERFTSRVVRDFDAVAERLTAPARQTVPETPWPSAVRPLGEDLVFVICFKRAEFERALGLAAPSPSANR